MKRGRAGRDGDGYGDMAEDTELEDELDAGAGTSGPSLKKQKMGRSSLEPFETGTESPSPPPSPPLSDYDDPHPEPLTPSAAPPPKGSLRKTPKKAAHNNDDGAAAATAHSGPPGSHAGKVKEEDDDEEENLAIEFGKGPTVDPDRMQAVLSKFTPEQMRRYECYRRSGFQKATMRRLLQSVAGCPVSVPMTIVMSGIAKMFVGELVETGRVVMTERKDSGPVRPCHIREAYRRLKLRGKVPRRTRPRLFH